MQEDPIVPDPDPGRCTCHVEIAAHPAFHCLSCSTGTATAIETASTSIGQGHERNRAGIAVSARAGAIAVIHYAGMSGMTDGTGPSRHCSLNCSSPFSSAFAWCKRCQLGVIVRRHADHRHSHGRHDQPVDLRGVSAFGRQVSVNISAAGCQQRCNWAAGAYANSFSSGGRIHEDNGGLPPLDRLQVCNYTIFFCHLYLLPPGNALCPDTIIIYNL